MLITHAPMLLFFTGAEGGRMQCCHFVWHRCAAGDMQTECDNPYDSRYRPERLLVYDTHPGGIGLAGQVGDACLQPLLMKCMCTADDRVLPLRTAPFKP
jgi:Domain of unknown function (DUF1998)